MSSSSSSSSSTSSAPAASAPAADVVSLVLVNARDGKRLVAQVSLSADSLGSLKRLAADNALFAAQQQQRQGRRRRQPRGATHAADPGGGGPAGDVRAFAFGKELRNDHRKLGSMGVGRQGWQTAVHFMMVGDGGAYLRPREVVEILDDDDDDEDDDDEKEEEEEEAAQEQNQDQEQRQEQEQEQEQQQERQEEREEEDVVDLTEEGDEQPTAAQTGRAVGKKRRAHQSGSGPARQRSRTRLT